jgi:hypothetical protein
VKPALIAILAALPVIATAQTSGSCARPFEATVGSSEISMTLRSGDVTIAGSDTQKLRVICSVRYGHTAGDVHVSYAAAHLSVYGGDHDGVRYRIEIPRSINLRVKLTAGNLDISGVAGDKDIDLNAGNLTVAVGDSKSYRDVQARVLAGNIVASPFGAERNGLFRRLQYENPKGSYRLRAEILAGNLTLH